MSAYGRRSPAWLALALLGASPAPWAHAAPVPLPPRPTQYATDRAQVFPSARLAALNEKLATFERVTSNQVLVYVDRSLPPGTSLDEMGATAIREWGVGQKGNSNGVILFVFTGDRALRLEVGYGLEGVLPDARARQITSDVVKPFFKKGDYAGGIEAGVEAVLAAVRGEGARERGASGYLPGLAGFMALGLSALCGLVFRSRKNPRSYVFFPLFAFGFAFVAGGIIVQGMLWAGAGIFLLLAGLLILASTHAPGLAGASSPSGVSSASSSSSWDASSSSSTSSSSSDASSSGSSSSDFSGGGGDGGGGGSSDNW
jgi:uncharacterized protein